MIINDRLNGIMCPQCGSVEFHLTDPPQCKQCRYRRGTMFRKAEGIIPWQDGDEFPEVLIRMFRDKKSDKEDDMKVIDDLP